MAPGKNEVPTRPMEQGELRFRVRQQPNGRDTADAEVIHEVIHDDCYGLRHLVDGWRARADGRPATVFDVGGNVGAFGVFALSLLPGARLVAFEPLPANAAMYRRHLADNGFADAGAVEDAAVRYTDPGGLRLVTFPGHEGMTTVMGRDDVAKLPASTRGKIVDTPVAATSLEAAADRHGFERIALCKMDCEYGEWDIFREADRAFWDRVDFIFGEFHGDHRKFADLLAATFPGRPTAQVVTYPILGQFWVGPAGSERTLALAERHFLRYAYGCARQEATDWHRRYRKLLGRPLLRQAYWLYCKIKGIDDFQLGADGPLDLHQDE